MWYFFVSDVWIVLFGPRTVVWHVDKFFFVFFTCRLTYTFAKAKSGSFCVKRQNLTSFLQKESVFQSSPCERTRGGDALTRGFPSILQSVCSPVSSASSRQNQGERKLTISLNLRSNLVFMGPAGFLRTWKTWKKNQGFFFYWKIYGKIRDVEFFLEKCIYFFLPSKMPILPFWSFMN